MTHSPEGLIAAMQLKRKVEEGERTGRGSKGISSGQSSQRIGSQRKRGSASAPAAMAERPPPSSAMEVWKRGPRCKTRGQKYRKREEARQPLHRKGQGRGSS